eukprot:1896091-Amphidinium_carterae.1
MPSPFIWMRSGRPRSGRGALPAEPGWKVVLGRPASRSKQEGCLPSDDGGSLTSSPVAVAVQRCRF